jgi:hypothetical protein
MLWDCNCVGCVRRQRQLTLGLAALAAGIFAAAAWL